MQPMLNIALRTARSAAEQIIRATERLDLIKSEQSDIANFVSETCNKVELSLVHNLQKTYPQHRVIGVYTGEHAALEEGDNTYWHINAIDNPGNFSNGLPSFALCMAAYVNGRLEHSLVLNPISGEEFTASRGHGAQLDGRRIRVSNRKTLTGALVGSGFYNRTSDRNFLSNHLDMQKALIFAGAQLHANGSPALSLVYTAAGRLDCFFQIGLDYSEIEAALLIVQEAGGLASDFNGGNSFTDQGSLVTANPKALKVLLQTLRPLSVISEN